MGRQWRLLLVSRLSEYAPSFAEEIHRSQIAMPCALVHLEMTSTAYEWTGVEFAAA
jgi:hypothetical protein